MQKKIENVYVYLKNLSDGKINKIDGNEFVEWFCLYGMRGRKMEIYPRSIHNKPGKSRKKRILVINRELSRYILGEILSNDENSIIKIKYKIRGQRKLVEAKPGRVLLASNDKMDDIIQSYHYLGYSDPFIVRSVKQNKSKAQKGK